jgi:transposase
MSKEFRAWKIDDVQLLPPSVQDYVPVDHLSRLVVSLVRESLDLSAIIVSYSSGLGQPPFDPRLMTALLLHGYASGLYSSRRIARAAVERSDFMMIVAGDPPDFRTISEFRRRHLKALAGLFVQVLKLAERAGLVKLGHVALDGTKIKANASKHKAMSYDRMKKREAELKTEVDRWLEAAEAAGYCSDANLRTLQRRRIDGYIATGRQKHGAGSAVTKKTSAPGSLIARMSTKLKRAGYRTRYRLRKQIVEPVFGQVKQARGFRQFLLRGIEKVRDEWALICTAHNLTKLARAA